MLLRLEHQPAEAVCHLGRALQDADDAEPAHAGHDGPLDLSGAQGLQPLALPAVEPWERGLQTCERLRKPLGGDHPDPGRRQVTRQLSVAGADVRGRDGPIRDRRSHRPEPRWQTDN